MRSTLVLLVLGAFAFTCISKEAGCATGDDADDDRCAILQGTVAINRHEERYRSVHRSQKGTVDKHSKTIVHAQEQTIGQHSESVVHALTQNESKVWPAEWVANQMFKGTDQLEKDFEAIQTAADDFNKAVHWDVHDMVFSVDANMTIDATREKVIQAYGKIHAAAMKLWQALVKPITSYVAGFGRIAPQQFSAALIASLSKVNEEGKMFADTFSQAAEELKALRGTAVCDHEGQSLYSVTKQASVLAHSLAGMSNNGFSRDLEAAMIALPDELEKHADWVMKKADEAFDHFRAKITPAVNQFTRGVAKVFKHHCENSRNWASQLQIGFLLLVVLSVVTFFA